MLRFAKYVFSITRIHYRSETRFCQAISLILDTVKPNLENTMDEDAICTPISEMSLWRLRTCAAVNYFNDSRGRIVSTVVKYKLNDATYKPFGTGHLTSQSFSGPLILKLKFPKYKESLTYWTAQVNIYSRTLLD